MFDDLDGSVEVATSCQRRFNAVWPCAAHALGQVRAALILLDAGLAFVADANARVALEHALLAQWILLTDGGDEAVVSEVRRQFRAKVVDITTFIELPEHLAPGDPVASDGPARRFLQLCDRFSPPIASDSDRGRKQKLLYTMYRGLGGAVHPSTRTWEQYFNWDDSGVSGLTKDGKPGPGIDLMPALALSAVLAVDAVEELRVGKPRLGKLGDLAKKYGLPASLRGDDQEPELQPKLHPDESG